jgi:hypothetical protein
MAASPPPAPGRIFISYRREETAYPAGWLYDRLAHRFADGQVFKDVDSIELGDDFVEVISSAVGSCDVLLALIGDRWLTITDEDGQRRLDDPNDFVRLEIEAALTRNVRVIPILVEGARMPRAAELPPSLARLVRRQALELNPARFDFDTGRLLKVLDKTLAEVRTTQQDAALTKAPAEAAPGSSTTEVEPEPQQQEQPERTPTPSIPPTPAPPAATRPPPDQTTPPERQPRLSRRARVLAGAGVGVGVVLVLLIVAIISNPQTPTEPQTTESVIFQDDFSSQANGWDDAGSTRVGGHYYNNDSYRIYATLGVDDGVAGGRPTSASIIYPSAPAKLSIKVDAQRLAGQQDTWYGITCRADANTGTPAYVFLIGDGYVSIGKDEASGFHSLKGIQASTIDADAKNHLDADCNGDEESVYLNLYVNGEPIIEWTDDANPLPIGTVGLFVATDTDTAVEAEFDNFSVTQL